MGNEAIFIPLHVQETSFVVQKWLFVTSSLLNIIAFICLFKQTPPHQAAIKNYLLLIQVEQHGVRFNDLHSHFRPLSSLPIY